MKRVREGSKNASGGSELHTISQRTWTERTRSTLYQRESRGTCQPLVYLPSAKRACAKISSRESPRLSIAVVQFKKPLYTQFLSLPLSYWLMALGMSLLELSLICPSLSLSFSIVLCLREQEATENWIEKTSHARRRWTSRFFFFIFKHLIIIDLHEIFMRWSRRKVNIKVFSRYTYSEQL